MQTPVQATNNAINADLVLALNQLLNLHQRSLPMYLHDARPWESDGAAIRVLREIIQDQTRTAEKVGALVVELGQRADNGRYPMSYTSLNDLAANYLVARLIKEQQGTIKAIESLRPRLAGHGLASEMAAEALGAAKAHLDSLREVLEK